MPDVKELWKNETLNRDRYLCQMSPGYSCVKYSYIFKGGSKFCQYSSPQSNSSIYCYSTEYNVYVRQGEQFQRMLPADLLIGHAG